MFDFDGSLTGAMSLGIGRKNKIEGCNERAGRI